MIDFVRFEFRDQSKFQFQARCEILQELENDMKEIFGIGKLEQTFDKYTNQINEYPLFMKIFNLKIKIFPRIARIEGSLHKLNNLRKNKINHNSNDFSRSQLCDNLEFISYLFPCINSAKITCLEFGLNINPPGLTKTLIEENLYLHKENLPQKSVPQEKKVYKEFSYEEYDLKIYDKARQYRDIVSQQEIMRFEMRLRNRILRKHNIQYIYDLKIKENIVGLFDAYIKRFKELRIIDSYHNSKVSDEDKKLLDEYISETYWRRLRENFHPQTIIRRKKELEKIVHKYSLDGTKNLIKQSLKVKFQQLLHT